VLLIGLFFFKNISNTLVGYVEKIGAFVLGEKPKKRTKKKKKGLFGYLAIPPDQLPSVRVYSVNCN
jgi:hypothetical protein